MKIRSGYLKRLLGGAVFGLYIGHLVLFLNPQIDVRLSVITPIVIAYAMIWGLLLGSVLWLLRVVRVRALGRPAGEFRPHGFGYVVAATFVSEITAPSLLKIKLIRSMVSPAPVTP